LVCTRLRIGIGAALVGLLGIAPSAAAHEAHPSKVVRYHGYRLVVPKAWPVFHLTRHSTTCVRFNRHAVYLGMPSANQRCPAHTAGRPRAILVEPTANGRATLVRRAPGGRPHETVKSPQKHTRARAAQAPAQPGAVYTGLGFDPCATPSAAAMSAWGSSPYRAVGVYIGGTNMACSQPNLTASWVSQESVAGWHLIPIYVGLQAPSNSCGCASISSGSAGTQGAAAARDAIARAQAIGLGPGNPLYDDMEAYTPGRTNTAAVLAFLGAWTAQLHASGYKSGVYSSADSGIVDLVSQYGTSYQEPDDIWVARWNGAKNTSDPNVPAADWGAHQRLHQYDGGHNETHGGVTINIDGDYLDAATAAAGSGSSGTPTVAAAPSLSIRPAADGGIALNPSWSGATGISSWQVLGGGNPGSLGAVTSPVSASKTLPIVIHSAYPYFAVQAIAATGQALGSSEPVPTPGHVAIFGNTVFVPRHGLGGVPVGCFSTVSCHVTTTISSGRSVVARTRSEHVPIGGGLAFFSLSSGARVALARARRFTAKITVRDAAGTSATRSLNLISFATSGRGPRRVLTQARGLKIIGATHFVSRGRVGAILAGCFAAAPCHVTTTITAGRQTIATTGPQFLGVNQLGYLYFSLTGAGRRLLASPRSGNQLPAHVTIADGSTTASADIALVSFR
jgi:hypothetical protein